MRQNPSGTPKSKRLKIRGCHATPFHVGMWNAWLAEFNRGPDEGLKAGIETMRHLLQMQDIGDGALVRYIGKIV